jgi:hypothetical protein
MKHDNVAAVRNAYAVAERKDLEGLSSVGHIICGAMAQRIDYQRYAAKDGRRLG